MKKRCSNCKLLKLHSEFHKNRCRPDGLQAYCKKCRNLINREKKFCSEKLAYIKLLKNIKEVSTSVTSKTCTKCNQTKPISEFSFIKTRGYYKSTCKKCCVKIEQKRVINKIREGLL